jgi:hypothetical protein
MSQRKTGICNSRFAWANQGTHEFRGGCALLPWLRAVSGTPSGRLRWLRCPAQAHLSCAPSPEWRVDVQKPQRLEDATLDLGSNLRPAPVRGSHWNSDLELALITQLLLKIPQAGTHRAMCAGQLTSGATSTLPLPTGMPT